MFYKLKRQLKKFLSKDELLNIDLVSIQGTNVILFGWVANQNRKIDSSSIDVHLKGVNLSHSIFSFSRPDVIQRHQLQNEAYCFGFLLVVDGFSGTLDDISINVSGTKFELAKQRFRQASNVAEILSHVPERQDESRKFVEQHGISLAGSSIPSQVVIRNKDKDVEKIKGILQGVDIAKVGALEILHAEALPEIHRIWKSKQSKNNNRELKVFGNEIEVPKVSIIIPLYGRYDFMQHQLADFSADPFMHEVEVIYVLDDPALQREVLITAHGLFKTFRYPFKLVLSERNRGFAGANNLGVEFATSEHLLLLNSDILPKENGWLGVYLEQFTSLEDVGIMGATLTYEDETIQHAGMEFREDSHYPGIWMNHHPYKGVPVDLVPLDDAFQAPITTGACMLMTAKLYRELEGFDPMYVLGDFEDSDLCLKVIDRGFKVYVSGKIRLYHLERLSQDLVDSGDWKFKLTLANGAYQANKWRNLIQEVSA
ncbi:glycosyltransferase [Aliiglaciecola sp. 2_MG-2023]|uniref:glycosyltransferase family 2 protein n=1 Tax=unclassified Aliiglaciecola TaxID=2593648 RepID=UPI0026E35C13|nr:MULTISPECIES: glycosyltransferase [unclassified Aliiglaciecola]MDO6709131.1 glycosyltransferase [Aliiglaciecola sp. 2_MG-2023]MDO6750279.1 glycosyltransferase [Aliiglaciecola sp. 1_MG-2023]